jgi:DNA-binding NarL/FixJ family response regulator
MKILIVEDDDETRHCLGDRLVAEGVEKVFEASDLAGALGVIRKADAILCDDAFPVTTGERPFELAWNTVYEAAQSLAKPFVLITTDQDTWFGALRQGVQVFKEQDAAEAVLHLVRSLGAHALTA